MQINAEEIASVIEREITDFQKAMDVSEVGEVIQVGDGIARIYGLENAMAGELLEFPNHVFGMVLNLEEDNVGCVLFGSDTLIKEGDVVKRTSRIMEIPVGQAVLGRVVDPLGQPVDGKGPIQADASYHVERKAPGVVYRQPVKEPLATGWKTVDAMFLAALYIPRSAPVLNMLLRKEFPQKGFRMQVLCASLYVLTCI